MAVVSPIGHHYNSTSSYNHQINMKIHSLKLQSANGNKESLDNEYCDKKSANRNTETTDPGNPILYCIACCLFSMGNCNRRCCEDVDDH